MSLSLGSAAITRRRSTARKPAWSTAITQPCSASLPPSPNSMISVHGNMYINAIKIVREVTGLGLKEAKDLVDAVNAGKPRVVRDEIELEAALAIRAKFESLAIVRIEHTGRTRQG